MADAPDNIVLVYLRRMDERLEQLAIDMREVKERLHILKQQGASLHAQYASLSGRIDRIETRLDRIERRLELTPAP